MPGVTYERLERIVRGKEVLVHVVTAPKPGSLYRLVPVLSNGTIAGTETVTQMQARLSRTATSVAVNGDLFSWEWSYPTGIFVRDGALHGRPTSSRSSLGIGLDGLLRIAQISFFGTWGVGEAPRTALNQLNRPLVGSQVGLFTPVWGAATPRRRGAVDVVVSGLPPTSVNVDLAGQVTEVRAGEAPRFPRAGRFCRPPAAALPDSRRSRCPGAPLVVKLILKPWWEQVADAIGGGPALVREGRIALPTSEGFSSYLLLKRHPRTAVGQLADGRIVLVAVDGRSSSAGMTMRELAVELRRAERRHRLRARRRREHDARVRRRRSQRAVRRLGAIGLGRADGHLLRRLRPDPERQRSSRRTATGRRKTSASPTSSCGPRPSTCAWSAREGACSGTTRGPGRPARIPVEPDLAGRPEGRWRWVVRATDEEGNASEAVRTFAVNNTLGFLDLSAERVKRGATVGVSFTLAHDARLAVSVESQEGTGARTIFAGWHKLGELDLTWNGRTAGGKVVRAGRYTVRVHAENRFGAVELVDSVVVRRAAYELPLPREQHHRRPDRRDRRRGRLRRLRPHARRRGPPGRQRDRHALRGRARGRRLSGDQVTLFGCDDRVDGTGATSSWRSPARSDTGSARCSAGPSVAYGGRPLLERHGRLLHLTPGEARSRGRLVRASRRVRRCSSRGSCPSCGRSSRSRPAWPRCASARTRS